MISIISELNIAYINSIKQILMLFFMFNYLVKVNASKLGSDKDTRDPEESIW